MVAAASATQIVVGWIFIIVGLVLIVLAVPALLKKAFAAETQTFSWGDVIGELLKLGPAGAVAALGVILILIGLVLVGIELPSL